MKLLVIFLLALTCLQLVETKRLLNTRKRRLSSEANRIARQNAREAHTLLPIIKRRLDLNVEGKPLPVKTLTLTASGKSDGSLTASDTSISYKQVGEWGIGSSNIPTARKVGESIKVTWTQDEKKMARVCYYGFAPWNMQLINAKFTVNKGTFSRQKELKAENLGVKEVCEWLTPVHCIGGKNDAELKYVSSEGDGVMYVKYFRVELYDIEEFKNMSGIYNYLSNEVFYAGKAFDNVLQAVNVIIKHVGEQVAKQQLAIKIGSTTGNVIAGTAIVASFFTAGMSLVVAGAVGATISIASAGANLLSTEMADEKILRAMQDLKEFQWKFEAKTDEFSKFVNYVSEKTNTDISLVQACMNKIKKAGKYGYKLYKLKKNFDNIGRMFTWIKDGKDAEWAIRSVKYGSDLESAVTRVGVNLGKEVSAMEKVSLQVGETTFGVCKVLERVNLLLLVADTFVTWTSKSPAEKECDEQIKKIETQQPILQEFYKPLDPSVTN